MENTPFLPLFIILFSAILIWMSGTKLALIADWLAERLHLGRAFIGAFFLAVATSLPELATTITASWLHNAPLAISNLLGGVNFQTAIISVVDFLLVRGSMTYFAKKPSLFQSGVFVIIQLSVLLLGMVVGPIFSFMNVGLWPIFLFLTYICMLFSLLQNEKSKESEKREISTPKKREASTSKLFLLFGLHTFIVLVAGWSIAYFADKLTIQWNYNSSLIGATLVAVATSLPEVSTTFGAVRQKAYDLAIANIFGSNAFTISLLFFADIFYRDGLILSKINRSDYYLISVGLLMTVIFLWGLSRRKNTTVFRFGYDSLFVLLTYVISLYFLFRYF